ncbi:hypothetical protein G4B88_011812 [Cannabis sativa]|uniref:CCHC-type domain-containing protein n=1 Tax=Cannabis sativa TaxID=3483 RepID=A0A7J6EET1_CANSA|nr:hypothetical protein G4B88_011812 [Cannabis sativa]
MDELLSKSNQLHVSDEDDWEVDQSFSSTIAKNTLRGRLCSNIDHSSGFLKKVLGRIWRLKEADWNVKIQEKYESGIVITVQNSDVAKIVMNGFYRFQIWMSINKPVWPGFLLPCGGTKKWIACKYEELPFMCFRCGKIGHSQKDCSSEFKEIIGEGGRQAKAYGTWLKGLKTSNSFALLVQKNGQEMEDQNVVQGGKHQEQIPMVAMEREATEKGICEETEKRNMGNSTQEDENGRGKRRIVESEEEMGVGKLQKTVNPPMNVSGSWNFFEVPIYYSQEVMRKTGEPSFVLGPSQKTISKEQRRKVAVKKDSKYRKEPNGILDSTSKVCGLKMKTVRRLFMTLGGPKVVLVLLENYG